MRRSSRHAILTILPLAAACSVELPCSATFAAQPPGDLAVVPAREEVQVDIRVDPRIELLLIVQHLTNDYAKMTNLITRFDFAYKREIEEHFRPYDKHTVVMTYHHLFQRGFAFDAGPHAALRLTEDEHLALRAPFPEDILARVGGAEAFEEFRSQLADFAQASGFWTFFEQHKPFYEELCQSVRERLKPGDLVAALNAYAGLPVTNAHLVLFPMGHPGGFAAQIEPDNGGIEVFAIVGPGGAADDKPVFGASWHESLIIHEFAHTIVNPLADEHPEQVAKSAALMDPIREQMARQAYRNWRTIVNEHIVRALEARIALQRHGEEAMQQKIAEDVKRSFVHLPALCKALERYEADRASYPTLGTFYPELLAIFDQAAAEASNEPKPAGDG